MTKIQQDLNIKKSKKINAARLMSMTERNKYMDEMKIFLKAKLQDTMKNDRPRYLATVKNLILQGMIKLIEPVVQIKCREEDVEDVKGMVDDIEREYSEFMSAQTGRDEYECKVIVLDDMFLDDGRDQGCGGIVLYTENSKIVCPNMLINRLHLAFEELLPAIRKNLFPSADKNRKM